MASPRFVFHIGPHKTGTTYLQHVIWSLMPALRDHGVLVPEAWKRRPRQSGHHRLALDLAQQAPTLRGDFAKAAEAGCDTVLISSEGLGGLRRQQVETLASALDGMDCAFVFYCRRWSDLIPSSWQELIRQGGSVTLPAYVRRLIDDPDRQSQVNFGLRLRPFADVFGRHRIHIVSYSNLVDSGCDIAEHFFTTFLPPAAHGLTRETEAAGRVRHPSMPIWQVETIRALNDIATRRGDAVGPSVRVWFLRSLQTLDLERLQRATASARRQLTLDDNHPRLRDLHEELFQAWGDRLVAPRDSSRFFEPRARTLEFIGPKRLASEMVQQLLARLYDEYRSEYAALGRPHPDAADDDVGAEAAIVD